MKNETKIYTVLPVSCSSGPKYAIRATSLEVITMTWLSLRY